MYSGYIRVSCDAGCSAVDMRRLSLACCGTDHLEGLQLLTRIKDDRLQEYMVATLAEVGNSGREDYMGKTTFGLRGKGDNGNWYV